MIGPERREGETSKAYRAFTIYCGLGDNRSIEQAARVLGKCVGTLNRWARRWAWSERALVHDDAMRAAERESALALAKAEGLDWAARYHELRKQEWEARQRLVKLAETITDRWLNSPDYKMGSLEGLARLLDMASLLGRRACEQVTERREVTGADGGPIRVEFEAALKRIYGEAKAEPAAVVEAEVLALAPAPEGGHEGA